jgi:hypothetical protein
MAVRLNDLDFYEVPPRTRCLPAIGAAVFVERTDDLT